MREIKFRAWDKEKKIMYPTHNPDIIWEPNLIELEAGNSDTVDLWEDDSTSIKAIVILMQFTGLKDKNGREIYEGDIVNTAPYVDCKAKGMKIDMYWRKVEYYIDRIIPFDYTDEYGAPAETCEIVGNIYENPELLKSL